MTTSPAEQRPVAEDQIFRHYYDEHPTPEDLMGSSAIQGRLARYLVQVLEWLFRAEGWFVASDLNIYRTKKRAEHPVAPDVALFQVVIDADAVRRMRSWRLYEPDRPPPAVVFEIASDTTWEFALEDKPEKYAALGAREYYAYDPNEPAYFPDGQTLRAWHMVDGAPVAQQPDAQGRVWSDVLQSYLVPDGAYLRLSDATGQRRLTQSQADQVAREQERGARELAEAQAAQERAAKESERAAKEAAWAKLRELGIDPTTLV